MVVLPGGWLGLTMDFVGARQKKNSVGFARPAAVATANVQLTPEWKIQCVEGHLHKHCCPDESHNSWSYHASKTITLHTFFLTSLAVIFLLVCSVCLCSNKYRN